MHKSWWDLTNKNEPKWKLFRIIITIKEIVPYFPPCFFFFFSFIIMFIFNSFALGFFHIVSLSRNDCDAHQFSHSFSVVFRLLCAVLSFVMDADENTYLCSAIVFVALKRNWAQSTKFFAIHSFVKSHRTTRKMKIFARKIIIYSWYYLNCMFCVALLSIRCISGLEH